MTRFRFICCLALLVGALLGRLDGAFAQGDPHQVCQPDAMRLCSQFIPDVAKITTCMSAHYSQLSQECRLAMGGGGHKHASGRRSRHEHARSHCGKHSRHCG